MSIQVKWANADQSIIYYQFPKSWNWHDFEESLEVGFGMTESVGHSVNAIFDLSKTKHLPDGAMLYWRKMLRVLPDNQRQLLFLSPSRSIQTAIELFLNINKRYADIVKIADTPQHAQSLLEAIESNRQTILVVEDEELIRSDIMELLNLEGFDVIEAADGLSGFMLAQRHKPNLILTDIAMPHMDGFQMVEALRNHNDTQHVPVVMLTAKTERNMMRHGMELGADDYITKPFATQELTGAIRSRLDRVQAIQSQAV